MLPTHGSDDRRAKRGQPRSHGSCLHDHVGMEETMRTSFARRRWTNRLAMCVLIVLVLPMLMVLQSGVAVGRTAGQRLHRERYPWSARCRIRRRRTWPRPRPTPRTRRRTARSTRAPSGSDTTRSRTRCCVPVPARCRWRSSRAHLATSPRRVRPDRALQRRSRSHLLRHGLAAGRYHFGHVQPEGGEPAGK